MHALSVSLCVTASTRSLPALLRGRYDSTNETAVAVTAIGCVACEFFLGIEAWQGVHAYVNAGNVKITDHWNQGYNILSTTGRQSAYYSIASLMGVSDPYPTPTGGNSH